MAVLVLAMLSILFHFYAFASFSLKLVSHPRASVYVCVCIVVPFFLQNYPSDFIRVHSHVFLLNWCRIPERVCIVCVCVCKLLCPSFSKIIFILSFRCIGICASFFLAPHPRAIVCVNVCVCLCVCIAVPFFLKNYLMSLVRSLVYIFSLCHIPVRVFVCVRVYMVVPFFCTIIHLISIGCIRSFFFLLLVPHPSPSICVCECAYVHSCALLYEKLFI